MAEFINTIKTIPHIIPILIVGGYLTMTYITYIIVNVTDRLTGKDLQDVDYIGMGVCWPFVWFISIIYIIGYCFIHSAQWISNGIVNFLQRKEKEESD